MSHILDDAFYIFSDLVQGCSIHLQYFSRFQFVEIHFIVKKTVTDIAGQHVSQMDNHNLFFGFREGRLETLSLGEGEPPEAEFRITGSYETFARISRAELGSQRALMTGKLKLKGNMVKALKLASIADRLNKVLATIPAAY